MATLFTDKNAPFHEWSANIVKDNKQLTHKGVVGQVRLIRLSDVINGHVVGRSMKNEELEPGKVVMKMDIEGDVTYGSGLYLKGVCPAVVSLWSPQLLLNCTTFKYATLM